MDDGTMPLVLAQAGSEGLIQLLPLVLILGVFYVLLIRPQQQKAKEHEAFVQALKAGEQVVTNSGLFGKVLELREHDVTLEIAPNVRVRHERAKIAAAVRKGGAAKASKED